MTGVATLLAGILSAAHGCYYPGPSPQGPVGVPILVFSKYDWRAPYFASWDGSTWNGGCDTPLPTIGQQSGLVVNQPNPRRSEMAAMALDNDRNAWGLIYKNGRWGSAFQISGDTGQTTTRCFDVAYEQLSGDAIFAAFDSSSSRVHYRVVDANGPTVDSDMSVPNSAAIKVLSLMAKRGSDEVMMLASGLTSSGGKYLLANRWTGNTWTGWVELVYGLQSTSTENFAGAYEALSGRAVVVYAAGTGSTPTYRVFSGTSWSDPATMGAIGGVAKWIRLAPQPKSNRILMVVEDDQRDINALTWSGSAWSSPTEVENNIPGTTRRAFDLAFELQGTTAVLAYAENGTNAIRYRTWNGTTWSAEASSPSLCRAVRVVQLRTGGLPGEIFVGASDDNRGMSLLRWNGTTMSAPQLVCNRLGGTADQESFMIGVPPAAGSSVKIVGWREVRNPDATP